MFFHANSRLPGDSAYTPVRMYLLRLRLGHRMFSSVIGRLENRAEEMSVSRLLAFCAVLRKQLTCPQSRPHNRYAELESSVARWHGWLDFLAHPTGQGVLPADTTPAERSALRRFVRALIYFSARHALGPRDPDLLAFLASLRSIWHADGFNVDSRMRIHALQWAREEGVVRIFPHDPYFAYSDCESRGAGLYCVVRHDEQHSPCACSGGLCWEA